MSKPRKSAQPSQAIKAVGLCFGFGLTLAVQIYALGILAGGWLDKKFGTTPWFLLVGTLVAVCLAFWQLLLGLGFWREGSGEEDVPAKGKDK